MSSFDFVIFRLLTSLDVDLSNALLVIVRVYEIDRDALDGHDWFLCAYNVGTIISIWELTTKSLRLPNGFGEWDGGRGIRAVYVDLFANGGITSRFVKAALERFRRKEENCFEDFHYSRRKIVFGCG